ncbi:MFS general substrate transporter [Glarea lozoyensis ATCC 20868]|uniref:MFS general substrate transporter n=1 Tax=Glarea lozoyensis (strain ATCC 20868 / MF5171) TaxID=1116229 RepID=S3D6A2_GLAL2|nr:MFS general substrate transporter [Glarea lozoyensis ATCC 20868]EPE33260.1 MFS general substrate transporter [Glarea lozoyensis ATCC 20868]
MDIETPTPEMSSSIETGSPPSKEEKMDVPIEKKSLSFMLAYGSVMASAFISTMDTVIVATALPAIAQGLNARSNEAYWLGSGFLFAQAVSQPLYGTLSGVFGRKSCFLFAMIVFTIASLFCATAQSIEWLIAARVFQGIGAGGINACGSMIITDMVSLRERAKYIGILSLASAIGLVSGIMMGAGIAGRASWRIIFYINLPLCVPAIAGIYFFIHLETGPLSVLEKLKRVDWVGVVVLTGSLISLLYGITSGGVIHPWDSGRVIASIVIAAFGLTVFLFYEHKYAKEPMIPLRIFASRTAAAAFVASFSLGFDLWAMQYYLIQYFLVTKRRSLVGAGVSILPGTVLVPFMAVAGGLLITKLQKFKAVNTAAWFFTTLGFALMTQLKIDSNKGVQYGFQIVYAFGAGVLFPGRTCAVQACQTDDDVPMATALVSFVLSLGQSFGVGIGGVVFQNQWNKHTQKSILAGSIPPQYVLSYRQAEQAFELIKPFPPSVQVVYRIIMADVIDAIFIVIAAFAGLALLTSLVSRDLSLDRDTRSAQQFKEKRKSKKGDGVVMISALEEKVV